MIELDEYAQKAALELTGEKLNSQVDSDISAMGKRLSDDPGDRVWTEEMIDSIYADAALFLSKMIPLPIADDPGLAEMKRMEYLMSKAPCLARLDELAAYAAKDKYDEKSTP